MIYFIRGTAGELDVFKLGYTARPIERRLAELQRQTPFMRLTLLGVCPGDRGLEQTWHLVFSDEHAGGEWFKYAPVAELIPTFISDGWYHLGGEDPNRCSCGYCAAAWLQYLGIYPP